MQLICNELSFFPLAENSYIVEQRFLTFLKTFKESKDKYSFSHILFPMSYATQKVTTSLNFIEWISILSNPILKNLILDLIKAPYLDELENDELEQFVQSRYQIINDDVPVNYSPFGLPIAFIKKVPTISLNSHQFWEKRKIHLQKINEAPDDNVNFVSYNICKLGDIESTELIEWSNNSMPNFISSIEHLKSYLSYNRYKLEFSENFIEQLFDWKENNLETYKYLLLLMKDVEIHPFSGGMGQTENLKYRGKEASKRITQIDRLSYSIENNVVTFVACKGHYEFH